VTGPAGYDHDSSNHVTCPRTPSAAAPCIARDGRDALTPAGACAGCGATPGRLIAILARDYPPAADWITPGGGDPAEMIGVREAARRLGVHENTIRNWNEDGLLPAVRLPHPARYRRFRAADVEILKQVGDPAGLADTLAVLVRKAVQP